MKKLLAIMALAAGSMFAQTHFSIGVNIGGGYRPAYYAPRPVYVAPAPVYVEPGYGYVADVPPCPGPGYTWIDGYWGDGGYGRRSWIAGYWRAPVVRYGGYRNYGYGYAAPRYQGYSSGYSRGSGYYERGRGSYEHGYRGRR